ncbi:hypothetical protein HDU76_006982 [Blyttiomyces sp. JEL0837]|nr:hypothetical protein HDU76_006982 [Blyttiomyces sp. JEL0837]
MFKLNAGVASSSSGSTTSSISSNKFKAAMNSLNSFFAVSMAAANTTTTTSTNATEDTSSKVICEDNPTNIQPWSGIDLEEPSHLFNFEAHSYAWIVCGVLAFLATVISLHLIFRHLRNFHRPLEQTHIVRILLLVPIYAIISWFSFRYYTRAVYYNIIRDCYEAFVIYSFYALIMQYLGETPSVQKMALMSKPTRMKFPPPFGFFIGHYNPTSSTFLRNMRALVLQYVLVRPLMTLLAVIEQSRGKFCAESMSPKYGHFWYMAINMISVSACMYGLITIYVTIKEEIAEHKPLPKFLSIKLVILLTLFQTFILSMLVHFGVIHATQFWTRTNIANGINSILICFEMLIASIVHRSSFPADPYISVGHATGVFGALKVALNPLDIFREMYRSGQHFVYVIRGRGRKVEGGYENELSEKKEGGQSGQALVAGGGVSEDTSLALFNAAQEQEQV